MFVKKLNSSVVGAAAFCTVMAAVPAAAQTAATFDFTTGTRAETTGSLTYTVGGVSVIATAYHFNDNSGTTAGTVVSATLGNYVPDGLGVRYGSDPSDTTGTNGKGGNDTTGTHQIDNVGGGVDFIALQFSQAVTLTQIGRTAFDLAGVSTRDDDASIYGFNSTAAYGALNLTGQTFAYGLFTDLSGSGTSSNGGSDTKTVTGTGANNVYLIAANVGSGDRDDGFKLNGVNVSYSPVAPVVAAAPEPATWSMMIAGFGGVGLAMRRRKDGKRVAATA